MAHATQKHGVGSFQTDESEMLSEIIDIFKPPPIENEMISGKEVIISSVNPITDEGPYEYVVKTSDREYLDMPSTTLLGCISVVKEDGIDANDEADDFSVVNLVGNSIIKQAELYVNDTQVMNQSTGTYGKIIFV